MFNSNDLFSDINPLAKYYTQFKVEERILLTSHSHQAWPDCSFNGIKNAWDDAAKLIDEKWELAFQKADKVREGFAALLNVNPNGIVLGQNTHDLIIKLFSALDLKKRPKVIVTDSEFHTVRRQTDKLSESGLIDLIKIPAEPIENLSERIAKEIDNKTSIVIVSKVFFNSAKILNDISIISEKCDNSGTILLIDAYHALNAIPFDLKAEKLESAYIVGGGYKYCQYGEGNCFLRIPDDCVLRPIITGWFSEFTALANKRENNKVQYGPNHWIFAGSTYDVTSHYRAVEVMNFFREMNLTPDLLRQVSRLQIDFLASEFDLNIGNNEKIYRDTEYNLSKTGGFLVLKSNYSSEITKELYKRNISVDYRGDNLRLGPAPFMSKLQLSDSIIALKEIIKSL